jgi:hypothetical protein
MQHIEVIRDQIEKNLISSYSKYDDKKSLVNELTKLIHMTDGEVFKIIKRQWIKNS